MTQEDLSTSSEGQDTSPKTKPVCKLCEHWRGSVGSPQGSCRGNPPQVVSSSEYRWPVTAADESGCRLFALDAVKQKANAGVVQSSAAEESRMRQLAAELLAKAESGGFDHPEFPGVNEIVPVVDTVNPAPFVSPLVPKPRGLKANVPEPHIPVLTVDQMRKFKGQSA